MSQKQNPIANNNSRQRTVTRNIVFLGLLSAVAAVLSAIEIPLFPMAPHLKYDPGDIVILIGALHFGPMAGVFISLVVSFIQTFLIHGSGGLYGLLMHLIASSVMSAVVGLVYKRSQKNFSSLVVAMVIGSLAMVLAMIGANLVITPFYLKEMSREAIYKTIVPVVIPFNAIKAAINSVGAVVLHQALDRAKVFDRLKNGAA